LRSELLRNELMSRNLQHSFQHARVANTSRPELLLNHFPALVFERSWLSKFHRSLGCAATA